MKVTLDLDNPPVLSEATLSRLDAMTAEEIQRNAETDPDNPPLTDDELNVVRVARTVQAVRRARGMSQSEFASAYRITLARLKDWEQGRRRPDSAALAYLETIRHEPEAVARALAQVETVQ